jgi:glucosyl-3-phosphoglycerate synthase
MDHRAETWYRRRTSHWQDWPLAALLDAKQRSGARISVVIPARNEVQTVAGVVGPLAQALLADAPLVDELVVIDSDSTDGTAEAAAAAGAVVHRAS